MSLCHFYTEFVPAAKESGMPLLYSIDIPAIRNLPVISASTKRKESDWLSFYSRRLLLNENIFRIFQFICCGDFRLKSFRSKQNFVGGFISTVENEPDERNVSELLKNFLGFVSIEYYSYTANSWNSEERAVSHFRRLAGAADCNHRVRKSL